MRDGGGRGGGGPGGGVRECRSEFEISEGRRARVFGMAKRNARLSRPDGSDAKRSVTPAGPTGTRSRCSHSAVSAPSPFPVRFLLLVGRRRSSRPLRFSTAGNRFGTTPRANHTRPRKRRKTPRGLGESSSTAQPAPTTSLTPLRPPAVPVTAAARSPRPTAGRTSAGGPVAFVIFAGILSVFRASTNRLPSSISLRMIIFNTNRCRRLTAGLVRGRWPGRTLLKTKRVVLISIR